MSDKTQTAVEWLIAELNKTGFAQVVTDEEIAKAIEIEKQQIMKSVEDGFNEGSKHPEDVKIQSAEQYYTETYKL